MNDIMERQNLKGGLSNFFTPSTLAATLELIQLQRTGLVAVRWGIMNGDMGQAIRHLHTTMNASKDIESLLTGRYNPAERRSPRYINRQELGTMVHGELAMALGYINEMRELLATMKYEIIYGLVWDGEPLLSWMDRIIWNTEQLEILLRRHI
jgi:hypothetical protein